MTRFMDRVRTRRNSARRTRAIDRALREAPSASLRRELMEIASRYE